MQEYEVRAATDSDREALRAFLEREAGSPYQARMGELMACHEMPAFVAVAGGEIIGVATYQLGRDGGCEMTTLFASTRHGGLGTALVERVKAAARAGGASRLWLVTTNDNIEAMRFYQRRGFRFAAVYPGAVDESRAKLKPEIPLVGNFDIPLRDEIVFEAALD